MSPPRLEFSIEDGLDATWDEDRIAALVHTIVSRELPHRDYVVSLHLVSDATIRALNAEHRSKDAVTDVLSFPLIDSRDFVLPPGETIQLGDVVISYPTALSQADDFGHSVEREVAYLVAHGVLHILGYDHEDEAERGVMRAKEEEALTPLGFTR